MQKLCGIFAIILFMGISFSFTHRPVASRNPVVKGVVLSLATGKPLANTHVYIVHGEEEALTNSRGEFSIETSKSFPLTITAYHEGYRKFETTVSSAGQRLVIKLRNE